MGGPPKFRTGGSELDPRGLPASEVLSLIIVNHKLASQKVVTVTLDSITLCANFAHINEFSTARKVYLLAGPESDADPTPAGHNPSTCSCAKSARRQHLA